MKLSDKVREALHNALSSRGAEAKELADSLDKSSNVSDNTIYTDVGFMIATAVDNTDAVTMGLQVGDLVAVINTSGQTIQTIAVAEEFASAVAIGDLLIAKRKI